ncbi:MULTISPECIES: hypothetical protein [unclassified Moraxella]|uniref:hypothetical protein n=1 Tax=unclassified Moraxella TaxID=2685852 RepID=UPI00359EC429
MLGRSVRSVLVLIFVDGYIWAVGLVFACCMLWRLLYSNKVPIKKQQGRTLPLVVCIACMIKAVGLALI